MPKDKAVSLLKAHIRANQTKEQAEKKAEEVRRYYDPTYNPKIPRQRPQ